MRALKVLVVGMGVLIVAGTVTLVVLLVQRAGGGRAGEVAARASLDLPPGTQIVSVAGAGERFAVHVRGPAGEWVVFVDSRTGRPVGELRPGGAVPTR